LTERGRHCAAFVGISEHLQSAKRVATERVSDIAATAQRDEISATGGVDVRLYRCSRHPVTARCEHRDLPGDPRELLRSRRAMTITARANRGGGRSERTKANSK
jgi:hypothetical protein